MYYHNAVFRPVIRSQLVYPTCPSLQSHFPQPIQRPLVSSNILQEIHHELPQAIQVIPKSPNEMNFVTTKPIENLSKSICQRHIWRILLGFILCLLVAASIAIPLMTLSAFIVSTKTKTTTTTITTISLPSQCSTATLIIDNTRNADYSVANYTCDQSGALASTGWYRFYGPAGTILANYAVPINQCGTQATGWHREVYPSTAGSTISGIVCYNWSDNSCNWSNSIQITNCNGYYVFYLPPPPVCNLRYCTM